MQKEGLTQTRLNVILDSHQGLYEISQLLPHTTLRTIFTYWSVVHRTTCESGRTLPNRKSIRRKYVGGLFSVVTPE